MKTIVFAYHNIGCIGIEKLIEKGYDIQAVFTHQDNPNENIWFRSVARLAAEKGIPVYSPEDVNHPIWQERIAGLKPDVLFSFYYRNLIKKPILDLAPQGVFNLHGSLLPKYRGRSPINWAILNGETESGVTLHAMTKRPDQGAIVGQESFSILKDETAKDVFGKAELATGKLLDQCLPQILQGTNQLRPQVEEDATYFGGRSPKDGEINWTESAEKIHDLVRAVSDPYPGAFSFFGNKKILIWKTKFSDGPTSHQPGTIIDANPLNVACGKGELTVVLGQVEHGVTLGGAQLAEECGLVKGTLFKQTTLRKSRKQKVLILGVNGFIGNHLSERLLECGNYEVYGMDINDHSLKRLESHPDFHFFEGDIRINREWIEYHVRKCDIVLPLVAIATPIAYTKNPLNVFQLDFEENLRIVRYCVKYNKRIIFPSTSEVYGMCPDPQFDEDNSMLCLGPIQKQRWIYSCSKQLLDRVIWAYGKKEGLRFTLFRPFNWIGPRLDSLESARIGSSRVITQLILNLVEGTPIRLVDGGTQRRSFTDISDGIGCLEKIIKDENQNCNQQIFNIGNPENDLSIAELADLLIDEFEKHPLRKHFPPFAGIKIIEAKTYYGEGYQDVENRTPKIKKAKQLLGWEPGIPLRESVSNTLSFFLEQVVGAGK